MLWSNNKCIGELESEIVQKNSNFDSAAAELELSERHFSFVQYAVSLMWVEVQSQGPQ